MTKMVMQMHRKAGCAVGRAPLLQVVHCQPATRFRTYSQKGKVTDRKKSGYMAVVYIAQT
jgi:hypothetical protein